MRLIGKGAFTKCYLNDDGVTVTLRTKDKAKECLALWGYTDFDSYLFPSLERLDYDHNGVGTYSMQYYAPTKGLKNHLENRQWELYQALRKLTPAFGGNSKRYKDYWHNAFNSLSDDFEEEKEALNQALDSLGNYGTDIQFEISPRNVRVINGKLLLLDCFFFVHQLKETYK